MRAEATAIADLTAKENARSAAEERDTSATQENATARVRTAAAVDALVDTIGRSIETLNAETASIKLNSEAWAQNAIARGRAIGAAQGSSAGGVAEAEGASAGARAPRRPPAVPLITFPGEEVPARAPGASSGAARAGAGDLASVAERNAEALAGQAERQAVVNDVTNQSVAAYAASSQALQRHGALTSEFFTGLARGEVTLKEFESQMVITLGKFSGWAVAGGLVYGAFDAVKNIASGIEATQSGVSQLKRSLGEKVNVPEAEAGFRRVSQEVNVPIAKVAEAQFYAARAFPNQKESLDVAGTAVRAEKLDEVPVQEAVKSFGALNVEFGLSAAGIKSIFDELDAGQLKFNARLNQTLPQIGRAAASFANAGGTPTQLVQQIIELNRATGGGGGQGGGNPATFLIREAGNLAKPSTEDTLRQFGFNPKHAQQNIGTFNEEAQDKYAKGELSKKDLQELAVAVGGGTANGLRYGLPLLAAGKSGLAGDVRRDINPEAAKGSAQEDLSHKLEQLNEQGHKASITLQAVGSDLASIGVGPALTDAAHGINVVLGGVELLAGGLAFLLKPLTELPPELRIAAEAVLAYKGAQLALRSGPGLAAGSLANQAGLTFAGGGSKELTAVVASQRSYTDFLKNEQEKLSNAGLLASSKAKLAGAQVASFAGPEGANRPAEEGDEQAAYDKQLAVLTQKEADTAVAQTAARQAQLDQQVILLDAEKTLAQLTSKRVAITERLNLASEKGLYAAQLGAPNTKPILAPSAAAAEAQGRGTPIVGGTAAASGEVEATSAGSAAVTAEAAAALTTSEVVGRSLGTATLSVKGLAPKLLGLGASLKDFVLGLGPLGLAIAAFAALDVVSKLSGSTGQFEKGLTALTASETEVSSELDALQKAKKARAARPSFLGSVIHDTFAAVQHPVQFLESQVDEGAHPDTFSSDQRIKLTQKAKQLEDAAKSGKYKDFGKAVALPGEVLQEYAAKIEEEFTKVGEGGSGGEKAATALERNLKLQFDKLKLFGASGSGLQTLQELETAYGAELSKVASSGSESGLDEFAKESEEETKGITEAVAREVRRGTKFAHSTSERAAVLNAAKAKLSEAYKNQATIPLAKAEEELESTQKQLTEVTAQLGAKPGGGTEAALKKRKQALENERQKQQAAIPLHKAADANTKEALKEAEESSGKEAYQADSGEIKAKGSLAQASAGASKQKQNAAQLKEYKEQLKAAEKDLTGTERSNVIDELRAQIEKTEQAAGADALSLLQAKGGVREAAVPNQQPVATAKAALRTAEESLKEIESHKKDFSAEEYLGAIASFLKAKRASEEAVSQEALKISQFQTQMEQARSEGNALAQAQEGLAGAQRELGKAKGPEETRTAELNIVKEQNAVRKALRERITEEGELLKSKTTNPVTQAKDEVATDKRLLASAEGPDEKIKDQTTLNNAQSAYKAALVSNREKEIAFQEEMGNISKQQAIQQLNDLLKLHDLAKGTREELKSKIRGLEKGAASNQVFDLAPGSIKLPTAYDVHSAAAQAVARGSSLLAHGGAPVAVVSQSNQITINVANASDVPKVGEEMDRVTGGKLHTSLRKAGIRGI